MRNEGRGYVAFELAKRRILLELGVDLNRGESGQEAPSFGARSSARIPEDAGCVLTRRSGHRESARRRTGSYFVDAERLRVCSDGRRESQRSNDCEVPHGTVPLHLHPPVFRQASRQRVWGKQGDIEEGNCGLRATRRRQYIMKAMTSSSVRVLGSRTSESDRVLTADALAFIGKL